MFSKRLREVDRLRLQFLAARERQQSLGQGRATLGRLYRVGDQALAPVVGGKPLLQQVQTAQHRHQQVVEVVGDATGQLTDRIELLRLEQLSERFFTLPRPLVDPFFEFFIELTQLIRRRFELGGSLPNPVFQVGIQTLKFPGLAVQVREHPDLGTQNFRNDGNGDIINGSRRIPAQTVRFRHHHGRYENDGSMLVTRVLPDHADELEAVLLRHTDIHENDGDIVAQEMLQRLSAGLRLYQIFAQLMEHDLVA